MELKDYEGILFPNDKGDNPNRPDVKGRININGVIYQLSGWKNTSKTSGAQYIKLKAEGTYTANLGLEQPSMEIKETKDTLIKEPKFNMPAQKPAPKPAPEVTDLPF